jgi:hypothetical protein
MRLKSMQAKQFPMLRALVAVLALLITAGCCGICIDRNNRPNFRYFVTYTCRNATPIGRTFRTDQNGVLTIPDCDQIFRVTPVGP